MPLPRIENVRVILIFLLVLWVILSGDVDTPLISNPSFSDFQKARQREALQVLNTTEWGDLSPDLPNGYLNLTGFREDDGYTWEDLDRFRGRCREWSRNAFSFVAHGDGGNGDNDWVKGPEQITWLNTTGTVFGEWVRHLGTSERQATNYNLSAISPGLGWPAGNTEWDRNITGAYGTVLVRLSESAEGTKYEEKAEGRKPRSSDLARKVAASVEFQDVASGSRSWDMRLHGVHWPRQGAILLTTTSEKFAGIFGLPHLAPGEDFFLSGQQLLNKSIHDDLEQRQKYTFSDTVNNLWTSEPSGTEDPWSLTPHCEYVMYLQLHPIESSLHSPFPDVADLENELRHPTGAPIGRVPPLRMSLVAWSPDCSYFLESKGPPHHAAIDGQHLVGMKEEVLDYTASKMLLAFAAVLWGQLWLLQEQIRETSTPSTKGRVSFYTASMMLLADGVVLFGALVWSLSATTSLLPCLLICYTSLMLMNLGGAFLRDVYHIQEPQRRNRTRPPNNTPRTTTPPPAPAPAENNNTLPQPVTVGPPRVASPPIIIPSDQDVDAEIAEATAAGAAAVPAALPQNATATTSTQPAPISFSQVVTFLFLIGFLTSLISITSASWAVTIRALYWNTLSFVYFSLWVPQIVRNMLRNSRQAFSWRFIIGQTTLRLVPFAYFYLYEDNFLFFKTDPWTFCVLLGWVWCQFCYLRFQDILGPRTGIPKFLYRWLPEVWDYHPLLKEDHVETGLLPIGLSKCGGGESSPEKARAGSIGQSSTKTDLGEGSRSRGGGERDRKRDKEAERWGIKICCVDCTICREVLEVPVVKEGAAEPAFSNPVAGLIARRAYMVTPCRHIFHTDCLGGWLKVRLQCPICREALPPL